MKKTETEKLNFPLKFDVKDYLSTSMIIKNNLNKLNDTGNDLFFNKSFEKSEHISSFDLFAHILEG